MNNNISHPSVSYAFIYEFNNDLSIQLATLLLYCTQHSHHRCLKPKDWF